MLVRRCQPKAVHVSAEPLILSKDTVHSEEIAFYATIAQFVVMSVCQPGRLFTGDDEAEAPVWVCGKVIRDKGKHSCKCGHPD